jgi:hypothetical protein
MGRSIHKGCDRELNPEGRSQPLPRCRHAELACPSISLPVCRARQFTRLLSPSPTQCALIRFITRSKHQYPAIILMCVAPHPHGRCLLHVRVCCWLRGVGQAPSTRCLMAQEEAKDEKQGMRECENGRMLSHTAGCQILAETERVVIF